MSAQRISGALAQQHEVDLVHLTRDHSPGTLVSRVDNNVSVFSLGETAHQAETMQLLELAAHNLHQNNPYHLVVGFYAVPVGAVAVSVARQLQLPSLVSLRGNDVDRAFYQSGRSGSLLWTLDKATRVVAVSKALQRKAQALTDRDDVVYLPNSVDGDLFFPEPEVAPKPRHILFVGEMRFKKGLDVLLAALSDLNGDWRLTLAGGARPEAVEKIERWKAAHPRQADRVRIIKYARDPERLRRLYAEAEVVINPALWEGMPNSVMEALACGRPVLATPVGGVPELMEHGEHGWLVPTYELDTFGEVLNELLDNPRREELGKAGRARMLAEFSLQSEAEAYLREISSLSSEP